MDIGQTLKTIRELNKLSQRELAKRAGVTNGTLSMIESNRVSPSVSSLKKILDGIPMSLVDFFSFDSDNKPDDPLKFFYRSDELPCLPSGSVIMKLIGRSYQNRMITFLDETYPPGTGTGTGHGSGEDMYSHVGEEAGIVIEGQLELTVEGEVVVLQPGDCYYFNSSRLHKFKNPFAEPVRIISAASPANF